MVVGGTELEMRGRCSAGQKVYCCLLAAQWILSVTKMCSCFIDGIESFTHKFLNLPLAPEWQDAFCSVFEYYMSMHVFIFIINLHTNTQIHTKHTHVFPGACLLGHPPGIGRDLLLKLWHLGTGWAHHKPGLWCVWYFMASLLDYLLNFIDKYSL